MAWQLATVFVGFPYRRSRFDLILSWYRDALPHGVEPTSLRPQRFIMAVGSHLCRVCHKREECANSQETTERAWLPVYRTQLLTIGV